MFWLALLKIFLLLTENKQDPIPTSDQSNDYEIPLQINNGQLIFYVSKTNRRMFGRFNSLAGGVHKKVLTPKVVNSNFPFIKWGKTTRF